MSARRTSTGRLMSESVSYPEWGGRFQINPDSRRRGALARRPMESYVVGFELGFGCGELGSGLLSGTGAGLLGGAGVGDGFGCGAGFGCGLLLILPLDSRIAPGSRSRSLQRSV